MMAAGVIISSTPTRLAKYLMALPSLKFFDSVLRAKPGTGHAPHPNRSLERSLAFSASISRSRAGACVCSDVSRRRAEAVTSVTARSNASALACDGLLKPDSFLTNCSAEAWISSSVAVGSKLNSVLMLRHICFLLCPPGPSVRSTVPRYLRTIHRKQDLHRGVILA